MKRGVEIRHLDMTRNFFPFLSESYMSKRKYSTYIFGVEVYTFQPSNCPGDWEGEDDVFYPSP